MRHGSLRLESQSHGYVWLRPSLVLVALALIGVLCVCGGSARAAHRVVAAGRFVDAAGRVVRGMEPHPAPAPALAQLSDGLMRTVEGTVIDAGPLRSRDRAKCGRALGHAASSQRIDLRVYSIEVVTDASDAQSPASGGVRLTVRWPLPARALQPFQCGERVRAVVRLLPPEIYHDPGVWSREEYLLDQGITSTATVGSIASSGSAAHPARSCRAAFSAWQRASTERLLRLARRHAQFARAPAPLSRRRHDAGRDGRRRPHLLTHALRVGFERTGSFHMLVVSGFHLAIVAGCLFWVLQDGCGCRAFRQRCSPSRPPSLTRSSPASPRRCSVRSGW